MELLLPAQFTTVVGGIVLVVVFSYLYSNSRDAHLGLWTGAWLAYTGRVFFEIAATLITPAVGILLPLSLAMVQLLNIAGGLLLLMGTFRFVGRRIHRIWYVVAALAVGWSIVAVAAGATTFAMSLPGSLFLGVASIITGISWLSCARSPQQPATSSCEARWSRLSGWAFILWGVHRLDYPLLVGVEWLAPYGYALGAAFAYTVAFGVLIAHFDRVRTLLVMSDKRYRDLFESSNSVMLLIDPTDGAIVDVNEAAERYYGWTRHQLKTMRITDINTLSPEETQAEMDLAAAESRSHFHFSHLHADGSVTDVEVYSGPADVNGRRLLYSIIHDITARRRSENELAEYKTRLEEMVAARTSELTATNERLEAIQESKDSILANMSHELRTPLNSIIGFSGLLASGMAGPLSPEQARQAEMVRASGRHLLALINDLLDVSAIDSGKTRPELQVVDVCEMLRAFSRTIEPLSRVKGLSLELDGCEEGASLLLVTDPRFLEQIMWNIVGNAIKFTDSGSVTISVNSEPHGAMVAVSDTGVGIGCDDLEKVFDDFTQLEAVHGAKNVGTGLGLAISRRLVAMLDGSIEVSSSPGQGSTFRVHIVDHGRS